MLLLFIHVNYELTFWLTLTQSTSLRSFSLALLKILSHLSYPTRPPLAMATPELAQAHNHADEAVRKRQSQRNLIVNRSGIVQLNISDQSQQGGRSNTRSHRSTSLFSGNTIFDSSSSTQPQFDQWSTGSTSMKGSVRVGVGLGEEGGGRGGRGWGEDGAASQPGIHQEGSRLRDRRSSASHVSQTRQQLQQRLFPYAAQPVTSITPHGAIKMAHSRMMPARLVEQPLPQIVKETTGKRRVTLNASDFSRYLDYNYFSSQAGKIQLLQLKSFYLLFIYLFIYYLFFIFVY